nr:hypothetical protein [Rhodoferax sp.]
MSTIAPGLLVTLGLCAGVALAFMAPLLPALIELMWPTDAKPLRVVREHDSNVSNFAHGFQHFVEQKFSDALRDLGTTEVRRIPMESGGACLLMGESAAFELDGKEHVALTVTSLLVGGGDVHLPDNVLYESEVYAAGSFSSGSLSAFRAVLAQGSATLGSGTVVLRWIHARQTLTVGSAAQLFGRASSDTCMVLEQGVAFERLHAPEIHFGASTVQAVAGAAQPDTVPRTVYEFAATHKGAMSAGIWRLDQSLEVPVASMCTTGLVVQGDLRVGAASRLPFPVKSNGDTLFQQGCRADAAVVATGRIDIGRDSHIRGPVISEVEVWVRRGSTVGTPQSPTTISAPRIVIETGVVVYGSVWARQQGEVILEKATEVA